MISKTKGGVTTLKDDDKDASSAVDLPGSEPRRAGSLPSHLCQEAGVVWARDGSGAPVRVVRPERR